MALVFPDYQPGFREMPDSELIGELSATEIRECQSMFEDRNMRVYQIKYDGQDFTCRGQLDSDGYWQWDSIVIGRNLEDSLRFLSDHCQTLILSLGNVCGIRARAEDFSEDIDHGIFRREEQPA